jgi:hypothetical protein
MGKWSKRSSSIRATGSRAQVMNGNAMKTTGNLRKNDLKYNKQGRIVSRKKSSRAKKENRLVKSGYVTKKGQFGSKFVGEQKTSKRRSKHRSKRF